MTAEARAAAVLDVHRWKSMGLLSVECECGQILYGEGPGPLTQFPADEAFRAHVAAALAEAGLLAADDLRARVEALADDLWRASPCGCGHRADFHTVGRFSGEPSVCVGGLGICGCEWSYTRIIQTRLRAALTATAQPAGGEGDG